MSDHRPGETPGISPAVPRRAAGALESEVLAILRGSGRPLTTGEVREQLASGQAGERSDLSYSTVVTIMSRLHAKGLLSRQRAGRGFAYAPVDEASVVAGRMRQALGAGTDRGAVLSRFVYGLSGRDARLLRQLLDGSARPQTGDPGSAGNPE